MSKFNFLLLAAVATIFTPLQVDADIFFDDFESGASVLWENNSGGWSDSGGVYQATTPDNFPNAHSALAIVLSDFEIELDINNVADGGIWLRSSAAPGTTIGRTGVVLITGVDGGLYWHNVTDGNDYGSSLNAVSGLFSVGVSDPHLRISVSGNDYSVFVDGSATAATSLTSSDFASGQIALYDNSSQTFDNVSVVPEPGTASLIGLFVVGLVCHRRKR